MEKNQKTQEIRLIDVFVIGPLLIYTGTAYKDKLPKMLSLSLVVIGAATIIYNGRNYYENLRKV